MLKLTRDDRGNFLVELQEKNGKFEIIKYKKITNPEELEAKLSDTYGVNCVLRKKRRFYNFANYSVNINLIEGVGEFLVVEGENLRKTIITEDFGIKNPEYITIPFNELKNSSAA